MTLLLQMSQSSNGTGQDASSLFSGSSMMAGMGSLSEQLLSQQIQNDFQSQSFSSMGSSLGAGSAYAGKPLHINQFDAALQVGGSGANADCGPTSLVMALHQVGLGVAGETAGSNAGEAVDLARLSMAASSAKDGLDASGGRSNVEHRTYTDFNDLARGAAAAGAKSELIQPSAAEIMRALAQGASVIASGTFAGKSPLPWTGDRGPDNATAPGYATAHLIEVSAYDPARQLFTVNDPARKQPIQVTGEALERFMAGNAGAMAIRR